MMWICNVMPIELIILWASHYVTYVTIYVGSSSQQINM